MGEEKSSQCDPPLVHCSLDGRFDCECGAERHDEVLADMIFALTMMVAAPGWRMSRRQRGGVPGATTGVDADERGYEGYVAKDGDDSVDRKGEPADLNQPAGLVAVATWRRSGP